MSSDLRWWGWNFEKQQWFPCLDDRWEEAVSPEGVIVHCKIEDRDTRRDHLMDRVRDIIEREWAR